jgi:hypothetical protein
MENGSAFVADTTKVEPGVWEIVEAPAVRGSHVLSLRFEYGDDGDAAFAVTVDVQSEDRSPATSSGALARTTCRIRLNNPL